MNRAKLGATMLGFSVMLAGLGMFLFVVLWVNNVEAEFGDIFKEQATHLGLFFIFGILTFIFGLIGSIFSMLPERRAVMPPPVPYSSPGPTYEPPQPPPQYPGYGPPQYGPPQYPGY